MLSARAITAVPTLQWDCPQASPSDPPAVRAVVSLGDSAIGEAGMIRLGAFGG
jgi:hypothetical protein